MDQQNATQQSARKNQRKEPTVHNALNHSRLAELMTDASMDQILALDLDLHVIAWNKACELATGTPRQEAIGQAFAEVAPGIDQFPMVAEAMDNALKGLKSFLPSEKAAYRAGYHEHHFIPLESAGSVMGVLVIIHDVAHRVKAEQELKRLNTELVRKAKELQEKNSELAQFNWIASHDLKEPLRKIYTFVEMVATREGTKLSDAARSNLRRAQSAAQRMGLLTDDIATFTQVAAPDEALTTVDLRLLLDEALQKHRRAVENTGAEVALPDNLPTISGYPAMLALMMNHLLGNALKFHAPGSQQPKVVVQYERCGGSGLAGLDPEADYHCITVTDNGIGIAPQYHEKVFGMFQRLYPEAGYRGTGMGLPICQKVAAAHEGMVTLESEEGAGATFRAYLKELG